MPKLVNSSLFIVNSFRKKSKILPTTNHEPRTTNKHFGQPGLMLIEILLALLFATTLAILLLITSSTLTQTYKSNMQGVAARIATTEIENLRKTTYASLPSSGTFTDPDLSKLTSGTAALTISSYQSSPDIKQATVTINWVQNGAPKQIILDTLIYKNGI